MHRLTSPSFGRIFRAGFISALFISLATASLHAGPTYHVGALATASPIATDVGTGIFRQGGKAADVAVAVGFTLAVVHPEAGNIGGGGFAVVRDGRTGAIAAIDFREAAPVAAHAKMYLDDTGGVIENSSTLGAKACGVPGTVAGLYGLWSKYGSKPWANLIAPAIALADTGFIVDQYLSTSLANAAEELKTFPETRAIFFANDRPPLVGERLIQHELAATLRLIASDPMTSFYKGKIADQMVACMKKNGGLITHEDIAAYQPIWRQPLHFTFDSLDFYAMPPPSSGGLIVGQILKLLEPFDLTNYMPTSPQYIHLFCSASKLAYADRSQHVGDPAFYHVPQGLLDDTYLASRRELIDTLAAIPSEKIAPGIPPTEESPQTTHFSVCDSSGTMIAITYTLNANYGSKLVVGGAGFLMNNEMDDFSIKPGVPNLYGLVGGDANKIQPGKRMLSSMSPTLVLKNDRPMLIVGSPGGSKIITTVAEAILGVIRFHRSIDEVTALPRFHHQWLPDKLYLEEASFPAETKEALEKLSYTVTRSKPWCDIQMVAIDSTGAMTSASDSRRNGRAGGY